MNRNTILGTFSLILLLLLIGAVFQKQGKSTKYIKSQIVERQSVAAETTTTVETNKELVAANNHFGFKLFSQIQSQSATQNIFISPTSIAIALAMARNGASNATLTAMTETLALDRIPNDAIAQSYRTLLETLQTRDSQVQLSIANSLWANQEVDLKPEFIQNSEEFYSARVTNLDFTDFKSKDIINGWVAENTNNKIPDIIEEISPENILFLVNAIYFKGSWTTQFDKDLTAEKPFYLTGDRSQSHPMMSQTGEYRYYENEQFQAVRIPYGDNKLSMYLFLPGEDSNLNEFSQQLTAENWQEWMGLLRSQPGTIEIPRFKLEYEQELNLALAALGMDIVFDRARADFSQMTDASVSIDRVKHKTFVEVNEEGTEAAGATSIGVRITSAIPSEPFEMKVNRPFFCAIRDDVTGTILFMGNIVDPS